MIAPEKTKNPAPSGAGFVSLKILFFAYVNPTPNAIRVVVVVVVVVVKRRLVIVE